MQPESTLYILQQTYIIAAAGFLAGLLIGLIFHFVRFTQLKRELKSAQGFLESEKLMKENMKKENNTLFGLKANKEQELAKKLADARAMIKRMDEDILLLQKSNEETENQLRITQPELHAIKLKLIEAQNTLARQKGQKGK